MIDLLTGLGGEILGYIVAAGVLLAGVAGFWFKAKREGRKAEQAKQAERTIENVEKATAARRNTDRSRVRKFDKPVK